MLYKRYIILFFIFFSICHIYSAQDDAIIAQRYFQNARSLFSIGKYQEAIPDLNLLIDKYSNTVFAGRAAMMLGEYYYREKQDIDRAFEYIQKTINISREEQTVSQAYYFRGEIYNNQDSKHYDIDKAIADFLRIINIYPESEFGDRSLYQLALLFERRNNLDRAIWFMEKYLFRVGSKDTGDPYGDIARIYLKKIDLENALIALSRSLEYAQTPFDLQRSRAFSTHLIRILKYQSKKTNFLYYSYDINPVGDRMRIIACAGDINYLYYLDARARNIVVYDRDLVYQRTINIDLRNPVNVFFDHHGRLIVNDRRQIFIDGKALSLSKYGRQLRNIRFVSLDNESNIFVIDDSFNSVMRFNKDGIYKGEVFVGYISDDEIMTVDSFDRVFVVSRKFRTINVISTKGEFIANKQFDNKHFNIIQPVDLIVDFIGNLYVLDRDGLIWIYDYNLEFLSQVDLRVFKIDRPQRMGFMPDGSISVIDNNNNVHLLQ